MPVFRRCSDDFGFQNAVPKPWVEVPPDVWFLLSASSAASAGTSPCRLMLNAPADQPDSETHIDGYRRERLTERRARWIAGLLCQ
jgi:hypothetical protein